MGCVLHFRRALEIVWRGSRGWTLVGIGLSDEFMTLNGIYTRMFTLQAGHYQ